MIFKKKKDWIACEAVFNKLCLHVTPKEISCLNHLKLSLICKRFLFKEIAIMPKRGATRLHEVVVNVPADAN